MPRFDRTGPYWGGGPRAGLQKGLCGLGANPLEKVNWKLIAMIGFGVVFLANVVIFLKENGKK